jgi:hypothetical protein
VTSNTYWDRALKSRDPRYARILSRLGYATRRMQAEAVTGEVNAPAQEPSTASEASDELSDLRAQYQEIVGKKPYHGWGADELRKRIDEALSS